MSGNGPRTKRETVPTLPFPSDRHSLNPLPDPPVGVGIPDENDCVDDFYRKLLLHPRLSRLEKAFVDVFDAMGGL